MVRELDHNVDGYVLLCIMDNWHGKGDLRASKSGPRRSWNDLLFPAVLTQRVAIDLARTRKKLQLCRW